MVSFVKSFFRPDDQTVIAHRLYMSVVERARAPVFYADLGVADTPSGRFSLVALHGFVLMERLGRDAGAAGLAQKIFDTMFADMDRNLREMGVGDLSVGKKIKSLAQHFYGLSAAVRDALNAEPGVLEEVIRRNLYGGEDPGAEILSVMSMDLRACVDALASQPLTELMQGEAAFPAVPRGSAHVD